MPEAWRPTIVQREHPFGEAGVRSSLEEVAKGIAQGSIDPRVRTWAGNQLIKVRDSGGKMETARDRAVALLQAVQKKLWIPDPVGAEYIPAAHLLACDEDTPDAVCIKAGDCDDLVVVLGSAFMSVGLYTLVVGHGYQKNVIQHVLCAVRVDGRWEYADPSALPRALPLGHCHDFQRERILSVPNIKVLCDANSCIRVDPSKWDPERSGFVEKGVFVGVGEVPVGVGPKLAWVVPGLPGTLGAEGASIGSKCLEKVAAAAASRGGGTSKSDAEHYIRTGGVCAAELFCASSGVPPQLCGVIADAILGVIVGPIVEFFSDIGDVLIASGVGDVASMRKWDNARLASAQVIEGVAQAVEDAYLALENMLVAELLKRMPLPSFEFESAREAREAVVFTKVRAALVKHGLPISPRAEVPSWTQLWSTWWSQNGKGKYAGEYEKWEHDSGVSFVLHAKLAVTQGQEYLEKLAIAAVPTFAELLPPEQLPAPTPKKTKSALPAVAGTAVVGGLLWWLFT